MNGGPERACLAIADVSGYTGYLAGVELDHAQDILADLIGTIATSMAPFELSKLEGDAAFMALPGDEIDGSSLQDTIEGTYLAFRRRLRDIQLASSCECDACVRIPVLDLKFVVHHGTIARQRMMGMEELVGPDVILVHRLLKNDVAAETGVGAYAAYTAAAVGAADIDPEPQGLVPHAETTDVAGEVELWIRDLGARWRDELEGEPRRIDDETVLTEHVWESPTPPSVTFDWLTSPAKRLLWDTSISGFEEEVADGRRGAGTSNHCMHGDDAIEEVILEWRPPDYWLVRGWIDTIPSKPGLYISDELEALPDGGTRVRYRTGRLEDEQTPPELFDQLMGMNHELYLANVERLRGMLEEVAGASAPSSAPASAGRHLSEPVAST